MGACKQPPCTLKPEFAVGCGTINTSGSWVVWYFGETNWAMFCVCFVWGSSLFPFGIPHGWLWKFPHHMSVSPWVPQIVLLLLTFTFSSSLGIALTISHKTFLGRSCTGGCSLYPPYREAACCILPSGLFQDIRHSSPWLSSTGFQNNILFKFFSDVSFLLF